MGLTTKLEIEYASGVPKEEELFVDCVQLSFGKYHPMKASFANRKFIFKDMRVRERFVDDLRRVCVGHKSGRRDQGAGLDMLQRWARAVGESRGKDEDTKEELLGEVLLSMVHKFLTVDDWYTEGSKCCVCPNKESNVEGLGRFVYHSQSGRCDQCKTLQGARAQKLPCPATSFFHACPRTILRTNPCHEQCLDKILTQVVVHPFERLQVEA
mmetsp:Transcript_90015/g.275533  ORF Transcript_90015/g.275533 Transcript_90015/m.275533 type:complete len:212 (-) Transcript_90015:7-642(-)